MADGFGFQARISPRPGSKWLQYFLNRSKFLSPVLRGGTPEVFPERLPQPLMAGEAGPANDIFDWSIRFPQQQCRPGEAAALDFIQQGCLGRGLKMPFQGPAIDANMMGDFGNPDLIVAVAPDEIHGRIYYVITRSFLAGLFDGRHVHQEMGGQANGLPGKLQ